MPGEHGFTLETPQGRLLHGRINLPKRPGPRPAVVVCHGFKGFMEWGFFPHLATLLAERGLTVVRFNLGGSGMRPGDELVTDVEAFRNATVGADLEDLEAVLGALGEEVAPGRVDRDRIGLFGHSRGGGLAVLAASRRPLAALVTWSAVSSFDRLDRAQVEEWRRRGEIPVVNSRTGQTLALGLAALEDIEAHREEYDLAAAAGRRTAPWLIVHGERDETVPVGEGRRLSAAARQPHELRLVAGADHTFGSKHPFPGPSPQLIEALNATQTWLRRHLGAEGEAGSA